MKLKLQNMTVEGMYVARAEKMNRNTGTFFNVLENVGTENNYSHTPGNIFTFDDSGIQINNKPDSVIAEKGCINVHVLTLGEKSENIRVIAGQFLPPVLIYEVVNKKREFGDGLPPGLDVYLNRKTPCIGTALFIKWFKEHYLKNKTSGNVLLLLDGHRVHCGPPLLLQTAVQSNVTVIRLPTHCTPTLQPLDEWFLGTLELIKKRNRSL